MMRDTNGNQIRVSTEHNLPCELVALQCYMLNFQNLVGMQKAMPEWALDLVSALVLDPQLSTHLCYSDSWGSQSETISMFTRTRIHAIYWLENICNVSYMNIHQTR